VSLWPLLRGETAAVRDHVFSELHAPWASRPYYGVRTERWKLARYEPGEDQLFDLATDPVERDNLATRAPERAAEPQRLLERDLGLT
jgi:hypothetical protein